MKIESDYICGWVFHYCDRPVNIAGNTAWIVSPGNGSSASQDGVSSLHPSLPNSLKSSEQGLGEHPEQAAGETEGEMCRKLFLFLDLHKMNGGLELWSTSTRDC